MSKITHSPSTRLDPSRLGRRQSVVEGKWKVSDCSRIHDLLSHQEGEIEYRFSFSRSSGKTKIESNLSGTVYMPCQRCFEPVEVELNTSGVQMVVFNEEDASTLPSDVDPVLVDEQGEVALITLIEDEILLGLPIVARHEDRLCGPRLTKAPSVNQTNTHKPFSDLATLINQA